MTVRDRVPHAPRRPVADARGRWLLLGASFWLVAGLQLDAWAHSTIPELESFWTPWHAVLYSGIAACGAVLAWLTLRALDGTPITAAALLGLPAAHRAALAGMALLLVGGGIDTLWHNLFGIETDLEIFVSPSHIPIILGMVLVAVSPALMRWAQSDAGRLTGADRALVIASMTLALVPLHIFSLHATALAWPRIGTGEDPMDSSGPDANAVHGYVLSTVLLLVPLVALGRRWRLPVGAGALLVGLPALVMWLVFSEFGYPWFPMAVVLGAALVELVARVVAPRVRRWSAEVRWAALGVLAPAVLWGLVLLVAAVLGEEGVRWNVHALTGILAWTMVAGGLTAVVGRRIGPAAR